MNPVAHTPVAPEHAGAHRRVRRAPARGRHRVTVRRNRGVEIGAACGQLAAERAGAPAPAAVARRRQLLVVAERGRARPRARGRERAARGGRGRGEHPDRRLRQPLPRRPQAREGRRRPPPPRRHGRPLRAEHHLRAGRRGRVPAADHAAARRPPDDRRAVALRRAVPGRRAGHDHLPRRGADEPDEVKRETLERIRAAGRQPGLAVSPETPMAASRRSRRSRTSSWS